MAGETEKKIDLFSLGMSSAYNFAAPTRKIRDLTTSLRSLASSRISLEFVMTHSYYDLNSDIRRPLLKPRMTSMTISSSFGGGYHPSGGKKEDESDGDNKADKDYNKAFGSISNTGLTSTGLGFDYTLGYRYTDSRSSVVRSKTQFIDWQSQFSPTTNWRMSYNCRYNIEDKRIESQDLSMGRDLHCWEAYFSWVPSGSGAGYYLKINIKADLKDIKIEETRGRLGGYRGY
jgi:hypothetical protein